MLDIVRYEPIIFYNITVIHISCLMYLTMGIPNFVSSELYTHTHTHTHIHIYIIVPAFQFVFKLYDVLLKYSQETLKIYVFNELNNSVA